MLFHLIKEGAFDEKIRRRAATGRVVYSPYLNERPLAGEEISKTDFVNLALLSSNLRPLPCDSLLSFCSTTMLATHCSENELHVRCMDDASDEMYHFTAVCNSDVSKFKKGLIAVQCLSFSEDDIGLDWCGFGNGIVLCEDGEYVQVRTFWRKNRTRSTILPGSFCTFAEDIPKLSAKGAQQSGIIVVTIDRPCFTSSRLFVLAENMVVRQKATSDTKKNSSYTLAVRILLTPIVSCSNGKLQIRFHDSCCLKFDILSISVQARGFQWVFDPFFASRFSSYLLMCIGKRAVYRFQDSVPMPFSDFILVFRQAANDSDLKRLLPAEAAVEGFMNSEGVYCATNPPFLVSKETVSEDFYKRLSATNKHVVILFNDKVRYVNMFESYRFHKLHERPDPKFMMKTGSDSGVVMTATRGASTVLAFFSNKEGDEGRDGESSFAFDKFHVEAQLLTVDNPSQYASAVDVPCRDYTRKLKLSDSEVADALRQAYARQFTDYAVLLDGEGDEIVKKLLILKAKYTLEVQAEASTSRSRKLRRLAFLLMDGWHQEYECAESYFVSAFRMCVRSMEADWRSLLVVTTFLRYLSMDAGTLGRRKSVSDIYYRSYEFVLLDHMFETHKVMRLIETWTSVVDKLDGWLAIKSTCFTKSDMSLMKTNFKRDNLKRVRNGEH